MAFPGSTNPSVAVTIYTKICNTVYTTMLKIMGESGPPWVTPLQPLKGAPNYPPDLDTIAKQHQYLHRRRRARGPTLYADAVFQGVIGFMNI